MDKRISYKIILDTETCNTLAQPLVYDFGFAVVDKKGNIYESYSFLIADIFFKESELMKSAYYFEKVPQYYQKIKNKQIQIVNFLTARKILLQTMKKYNCETVCAYNARFDVNALNTTLRYLTKSKYRYFFYNAEVWDILKMTRDTIAKQKTFIKFCDENNFLTKHKNPRPQVTAEVIYRYITADLNFDESHTAFEDVLIENQIMKKCFSQHKKMRKTLYK